ncbi:F-box only protein 6-like [Apostichopus japonicus]|uniref:F-box only protein 6-like n=1 Tax=Stichopus japonicus TaxID=307972 RepID=UPI003AB37E93
MMGINASRKERNAVRKDNLEDFGDDECLQAKGQMKVEINGRFVNIPEEIVIVILSFLPVKDLEKCARVSPLFGTLVNSSSLWKLKCEREGKYVKKIMAPCYPSDWRKFYLKEPFSRNLIKNPSGNDNFKHWKKLQDGGDKWLVEKDKGAGSGEKPPELLAIADGKPCNFATSYGWCCKCQVVDLVQEGFEEEMLDRLQPPLKVGDWYAARFDCGNLYNLEVVLHKTKKGGEKDVIDSFEYEEQTPQWAPNDWKEISHVFKDYGPGLRFISFTHKSKDTLFWAGHYGAKMAGSYVKVSFGED